MRGMNVFRSYKYHISTEVNKTALSANDDKRVIMEDEKHMLAYRHYEITEQNIPTWNK